MDDRLNSFHPIVHRPIVVHPQLLISAILVENIKCPGILGVTQLESFNERTIGRKQIRPFVHRLFVLLTLNSYHNLNPNTLSPKLSQKTSLPP